VFFFSQEDVKNKKNEIQTLEDASTDIMMMEDDEETASSCFTSLSVQTCSARDRCYDLTNFFAKKIGKKFGVFDSKQS
jgi:hypothetical protein